MSADVIGAHLPLQLFEPRLSGNAAAEALAAGEMAHQLTPKNAAPGIS